jgi:hypothetical protein
MKKKNFCKNCYAFLCYHCCVENKESPYINYSPIDEDNIKFRKAYMKYVMKEVFKNE